MKWSVKASAALAIACMLNACGATGERPKSVSDTFCLNDKPLSVNVAPDVGQDDPGNVFDSEPTVLATFAHNAVYHDLCSQGPR